MSVRGKDPKADLAMLKRRADYHSGSRLAELHAAAATHRARLDSSVKEAVRKSEKAAADVRVLEQRLAAKRKAASPEMLRAVGEHHERIAALSSAQRELTDATTPERRKHWSEEVNRLHKLIDQKTRSKERSSAADDRYFGHVVGEILFLENEVTNAQKAFAVLVERARVVMDSAQRKYKAIDDELAEAERTPFFGGDQ